MASETARADDRITQRNLDIPPTITIRPGAPVRVLVTCDLVLAPWSGNPGLMDRPGIERIADPTRAMSAFQDGDRNLWRRWTSVQRAKARVLASDHRLVSGTLDLADPDRG
jgi:hypothetical protein